MCPGFGECPALEPHRWSNRGWYRQGLGAAQLNLKGDRGLWFSKLQDIALGAVSFLQARVLLDPCLCLPFLPEFGTPLKVASPFVLAAGGALCAPHWLCGFCEYLGLGFSLMPIMIVNAVN